MEQQMIFSVSEANNFIKALLDRVPQLQEIFVRGEISNYKLYPSGHHYFTLKDAEGAMRCVLFKGNALRLRFRPENGMKVIAFGRISVFPRDGAYQLYVSELSPEGAGDLHVAFEQLKAQLEREGLFDPAHKKPLPKYPKTIAIITSPAGAAVHDMLRILRARWPLTEVKLLGVRVQGTEAPPEIVGALRYANRYKVADLIITGRGGGSIEDLWAFNDERVARAIYDSEIPVISAVGHEPDVTIADYVADARASTPSNAAEIAVPDQREIYRRLDALQTRMVQSEQKRVKALREQFEKTSRSRALQDPMAFIDDKRMLLDYTQKNLAALAQQQMAQRTQQFTALASKLDALSPLKVLGRGYAVARNEQGQILRAAQEAAAGEKIEVLLGQGSLNCTVNACNMGGNDDGKNV
jgi:exodeoxyribonuclease VII large subunit